jgi:exodeoxyribonuclease VII large subunit
VAACPIPVVSAIGHDGDRPLCDEVADLRCGTPSLAATAVLPDLTGLQRSVDAVLERAGAALGDRLAAGDRQLASVDPGRAVASGLDGAAQRLDRATIRLSGQHPEGRLEVATGRLARVDWRRPFWEAVGRADGRLLAERRHLHALSPQRTLERGYAVVTRADGAVLRSAAGLEVGEEVQGRLAAGTFTASVISTDSGRGPGFGAGPERREEAP